MREDSAKESVPNQAGSRVWQILAWMLAGAILSSALVAAFLAYGQPELLLEQLNLRYCG
jgi:hypothetical protein